MAHIKRLLYELIISIDRIAYGYFISVAVAVLSDARCAGRIVVACRLHVSAYGDRITLFAIRIV